MAHNESTVVSVPNDKARIFVKHLLIRRLLYKVHFTVFLIINVFLFILNLLEGPGAYQWWPWVFTGWGLFFFTDTYFMVNSKFGSVKNLHTFLFCLINAYFWYIDIYVNRHIEWAWIPTFSWGIILLLHWILINDLDRHLEDVKILGVLISDDAGRVLVDSINDSQKIKEQFNLSADKLEMIPMFISAIHSFSDEINIRGCSNFDVFGSNLKVLSVKNKKLTITGFISPKSNTSVARELFEKILHQFEEKFVNDLKFLEVSGNTTPFEAYRSTLSNQIQNVKVLL